MPKEFPTNKGTRILRALLNTEGLTVPELVAKDDTLNINSTSFTLKQLEIEGYVQRRPTHTQGHAYRWHAREAGVFVAELAIKLKIGG